MMTRKDYMKDSTRLHTEYYLQFATPLTRAQVINSIGTDALLASTDKHLNDVKIPFNDMGRGGNWWWDTVDINYSLLKEAGESNSPSTHTCVGKAVATFILKELRA